MTDHAADAARYTTFTRSAVNWDQFSKVRKHIVRRNLTLAEARRMCDDYNANRTPAQQRKGHKMEFTQQ
jgi:hypothetical protein